MEPRRPISDNDNYGPLTTEVVVVTYFNCGAYGADGKRIPTKKQLKTEMADHPGEVYFDGTALPPECFVLRGLLRVELGSSWYLTSRGSGHTEPTCGRPAPCHWR